MAVGPNTTPCTKIKLFSKIVGVINFINENMTSNVNQDTSYKDEKHMKQK